MDNFLMIRIIFFVLTSTCSSSPNYGPFQVEISRMDLCAGPKNKNCTILEPSGIIVNGGMLSMHLKVLQNNSPAKGKIVAMSNGKELIRLQMNKPCDHLFIRPLLESIFTISKSCMIMKGDYKIKLDMNEITTSYFGGKFFYGNVNFKALFYGSECNFSCSNLFVIIKPRENE